MAKLSLSSTHRRLALAGALAMVALAGAALAYHFTPRPLRAPTPADFPEMTNIPTGSFVMGSPEDEPEREGDEGPQHRVEIGAFAVSTYEITFAQWEACVAAGGCRRYRPSDEGFGRGQRPVIKVSWRDAQAYVQWLSAATGERYRLLTEAEWEYAARAGTSTAFATGVSITPAQAQFYAQATAPVGSFAPNAFGLHDMHGNVWEWVEDCYRPRYDAQAPPAGAQCTHGVLRGGGWINDGTSGLRSADRFRIKRSDREFYFGLRVARTLR